MVVNDEDRAFALTQSHLISEHKLRTGGVFNHFATDISFQESVRRGLLAECAYVHEFGGEIDTNLYPYGDGGRDFWLPLAMRRFPRCFKLNVKCKSVRSSLIGLIGSGTHLRVSKKEIEPETIYVFAVYYEKTDDADILKWEWGQTLIDANQLMEFKNSHGGKSYTLRYEELRELSELKRRRVSLRHYKLFRKRP